MQLIIGPGAVGTVLAAHLVDAGQEVKLVVPGDQVSSLSEAGELRVSRVRGRPPLTTSKPLMATAPDLSEAQYVFICVKHPDLAAVLDALPTQLPNTVTLVPCLNGVGAGQRIRQRFPGAHVAPLTVMFNAQLLEPLHARMTTRPRVLINSDDKTLLGLFDGSGMQVQRVHDEAAAWGKLLLNLANSICALTHSTFHDVLADPDLRTVFAALLDEATAVLDASAARYVAPVGMPYPLYRTLLTRGGPLPLLIGKLRTGFSRSSFPSMVADVEQGRPTEIDEINGEFVRLGQLCGVPTPLNSHVVEMVKSIEGKGSVKYLSAISLREAVLG